LAPAGRGFVAAPLRTRAAARDDHAIPSRRDAIMTTCPTAGDQPGYPYRRLLTEYRYVLALNVVCALIATFLFTDSRPFRFNFADAMCIGTLAYLFIYGTRLALWRGAARPH